MRTYEDLRDLADALGDNEQPWRCSAADVQLINEAADMLEFFFGQMQMHSPKMDGQHGYRFRGGWPMTHCVGPDSEAAVKAAIEEVKREQRERDDANN